MVLLRTLILSVFVVLAACGEKVQVFSPTGTSEQAIRGGSDDYNTSSVVGIYMQSGQGGSICSGSLIAPNLVLTAQHCIAELASPYVICGETPFGRLFSPNDVYVTTDRVMSQQATFYGVSEVLVPRQFEDTCGNDIALLILQNNIQPNEAVPMIPRVDSPPGNGDRYTAIGYGHVGNGSGAGSRRYVENRHIICTVGNCARQFPGQVAGNEFVGNNGICQGDSGGPAIDQNGQVLAAVSRGDESCGHPVYSAVYPWRDWIKSEALRAADMGGYRAADWAEPPVLDSDLDGYPDDADNCANVSNPDQHDLDDDGLGDACDASIDRECAVCRECDNDTDCGPGSVCGVGGICRMVCRDDSDCPGGGSTRCMDTGVDRICMNVNAEEAGFCPDDYTCGVVPQAPEPIDPVEDDDEDPDVDESPDVPYPEAPNTRPSETTDSNGPSTPQRDVTLAEPEDDGPERFKPMFTFGGCDVVPERGAPGSSFFFWIGLLGLGGLRRHRKRAIVRESGSL